MGFGRSLRGRGLHGRPLRGWGHGAGIHTSNGGVVIPAWIKRVGNRAADLDLYFAGGLAWNGKPETISTLLTCARNSDATYVKADGSRVKFNPDELRVGNNGLLIEASGTNVLKNSDGIGSTSWGLARASIVSGAAMSPDGTMTMSKIVEDTNTNTHNTTQVPTLTDNIDYCFVLESKAAERTWAYIQVTNKAGVPRLAYIDLSTGQMGNVAAGFTALPVQALAGGVYRWGVMFNAASGAGTPLVAIGPANGNLASSYAGDGSSGIYVGAADIVASSYPSSHIKTASTLTATRDADAVTGLPSVSGDFTDYFELGDAQGGAIILGGGDSTSLIERVSSTQIKATDGTNTVTATVGSGNTSQCKIVLARQGNSIKLAVNGGTIASGTLSSLDVSANQYGKKSGGSVTGRALVKRHSRFDAYLSDSEIGGLMA